MCSIDRIAIAFVSLCFATGIFASDTKYYRYLDKQGNVVIEDSVPPNQVGRGYEILDSYGRVISVIESIGTEEERQARIKQFEQQKYDQALLRRYSSIEDVEAARDRYIRELTIHLEALATSLDQAKQQLKDTDEAMEKITTDDEQFGMYLKNSNILKAEIAETQKQISDRRAELAEKESRFNMEFRRLKELKTP